jgi:hypothetical protein
MEERVRLPEDEPSGSKHVEDITKIKMLVSKRCILLVYIVLLYYNVRCQKKHIKYQVHITILF